jgi:hypothetical protein
MAAALGLSGGCGLFDRPTVAMVSGRDDHGELLRNAIGLQRSTADTAITGTVLDGTFVLVLRRDGPWAQVRSAGSLDEGWIEDHYLRGEAVLLDPPPPRRVTFLEVERRDSRVFVRVRFADDGTAEWAPATALKEVGAR